MCNSWMQAGNHPSVFTVFLNGEPWKEVHAAIFGRTLKLPKEVLSCSSLSEFEAAFYEAEVQLAKKCALRRLSLSPMLSSRLSEFLKCRLVSPQAIENVITDLSRLRLLDDQSYIDSFVRGQKARGRGPHRIVQELKRKGVRLKRPMINSYSLEEQKSAILHLLKTRYGSRNLKDRKEKQRTIAALARRGFDLELIIDNIGLLQ